MFDDLNTSIDFKKNEYVLLHFFRDSDVNNRKEVDNIKPINSIVSEDEKGQIDPFNGKEFQKIPIEIKTIKK